MAGIFDFLAKAGSKALGQGAFNVPGEGAGFGENISALFSDPNFLQGIGNAGGALSGGASIGEAFNPTDLIRQIQTQKANQDLLSQILGTTTPETPSALGAVETPVQADPTLLDPNGQSIGTPAQPEPTPIGSAGPDAITTKRTADGTTTTTFEPSKANLDSFGTSVPIESVTKTPKAGGAASPFFQGLLGG